MKNVEIDRVEASDRIKILVEAAQIYASRLYAALETGELGLQEFAALAKFNMSNLREHKPALVGVAMTVARIGYPDLSEEHYAVIETQLKEDM